LNSGHGSVSSTGIIELDADGAYYGGPMGIDLNTTFAYDGSYTLPNDTTLELSYSCGDGCNGSGTFALQFQSNCAVAMLDERQTQCTGNRIAFAGKVVLTRM
jgi:hypothetical protein